MSCVLWDLSRRLFGVCIVYRCIVLLVRRLGDLECWHHLFNWLDGEFCVEIKLMLKDRFSLKVCCCSHKVDLMRFSIKFDMQVIENFTVCNISGIWPKCSNCALVFKHFREFCKKSFQFWFSDIVRSINIDGRLMNISANNWILDFKFINFHNQISFYFVLDVSANMFSWWNLLRNHLLKETNRK